MSDPIERLTSLGDALEGAPMPLPPSQVRARGDRIRRRRHTLLAGAGAAVVAAVAVPVVALLPGAGPAGDDPDVADPVPAAPIGPANLLTGEDAVYPNGGGDWRTADTYRGDGQATISPCQRSTFTGLGADEVYVRTFEFTSGANDEVDPTLRFAEAVAQFPDDATAGAAYDTIRGWYDDCPPGSPDKFEGAAAEPVAIQVDGTAEARLLTSFEENEDVGTFLEVGVVLSGNRVALLDQVVPGQDYNWSRGTPVEQMLPVAAERLVLGNGRPEPSGPTAVGWPATVPDGFPLTSGWPEDDGSDEFRRAEPSEDNQAMAAAGDLRACGNDPVDPGAVDRTTARQNDASDFYVRELQLFPSDQEAITYLAHLRAVYGGCPVEGSTPETTTEVLDGAVGDESVVVTRVGEEIWRTVVNVVRVGNAVVVDLTSDEGLAADVDTLVVATRENLADVVAAMAPFGQRSTG